jgi:hypothetical protein
VASPTKPKAVSKRLFKQLDQLIELQIEQNRQLYKITALLVGQQLLTECVDYQGNARSPEDCAEITIESFSAALCLMSELDQRNRDYQYQKSEFFLDEESDEDDEDEDGGPVVSSSF